MAVAKVRGVNIEYDVIGSQGPWVVLITGGRRGRDEFVPLAEKIAANGYRVLVHDRRNTGASDVLIEGDDAEEIIWTDDLYDLLKQLNASPAFISGASSGARTSMLFALRHRDATRGLLLFRVTGGPFAAGRLPENYYGTYIKTAKEGGMAAICETDMYKERIKANPGNRERLMKMDPQKYIAVMSRWLDLFKAGANLPVMGVTEAQMQSLKGVPTLIIPGNDRTHSSESGRIAHRMIPGSEIHQLPITDQDVPLIPFEDWAPYEKEIADAFASFMKKSA